MMNHVSKTRNYVSKTRNYVSKTRNYVSKKRNYALQMMNFALTMMIFAGAMKFQASRGDYVFVPYSPDFELTSFTVCVWLVFNGRILIC